MEEMDIEKILQIRKNMREAISEDILEKCRMQNNRIVHAAYIMGWEAATIKAAEIASNDDDLYFI